MSSAGTNPGKSSTEDCPHCGRTFKRLKTHLPHCRMAPGPPVQQELRDGAFTAEGKKGPSKAKTKQRNLKSEGTLSRKQDVKDPASEGLSRHVDKPKKQRPVRTVAGSDQLQQHLPGGPAPLRSTGKKAPVKKTQAPQEAPRVSSQTQGERSQDAHAKTSVWDHIHVGLLSRKFQGDFTRSPAGSVWTPGLRNETSRFHQIPEDRTQKISPQIVQNVTHHGTELLERRPPYEGRLSARSLGEVQLKDLPAWMSSHAPRSPREGVALLDQGWRWYYRKYIDVRRGGIGGVGMLLVGYCVLSYMWSYEHLKLHRWRRHH